MKMSLRFCRRAPGSDYAGLTFRNRLVACSVLTAGARGGQCSSDRVGPASSSDWPGRPADNTDVESNRTARRDESRSCIWLSLGRNLCRRNSSAGRAEATFQVDESGQMLKGV